MLQRNTWFGMVLVTPNHPTEDQPVAMQSVQQSEAAIAARAYQIWETEGRPHGRDKDHWLKAVAELSTAEATPARKTLTLKTSRVRKKS